MNLLAEKPCKTYPDCPPPPMIKMLYSSAAVLVFLFITDMLFYGALADYFASDGMRETPLFLNLVIGYLIASVLFVIAYVHYAQPPRLTESEDKPRSRNRKGLLYGFTIGNLVFVPAVFIISSTEIDFDMARGLLDAVYHIVQLTLAGWMIAYILYRPPAQ